MRDAAPAEGHPAMTTPATTSATPASCAAPSRFPSTTYASATCHTRMVWDSSGSTTPGRLAALRNVSREDIASTNPMARKVGAMRRGMESMGAETAPERALIASTKK